MALYDFFVGSTEWYDAHSDYAHADAFPSLEWWRNNARCQNVYGVWEGQTENVLQITVELESDAVAQRIAYAVARRTGNEAVIVSRLTVTADEERSMGSTRAYRVSKEGRISGNRTLYGPPLEWLKGEDLGTVLTPDVKGDYVAFLVWQDASVTAVN